MKCKHMHKDAPEDTLCEDCIKEVPYEKDKKYFLELNKIVKGGKENGKVRL